MGNALPCCTDNDYSQTNKKNTSPRKPKTKNTKPTTPLV